MEPIYLVGAGLIVGFVTGALVGHNNQKDTTAIIAAVNSAKDAVTSHVTTLATAPVKP